MAIFLNIMENRPSDKNRQVVLMSIIIFDHFPIAFTKRMHYKWYWSWYQRHLAKYFINMQQVKDSVSYRVVSSVDNMSRHDETWRDVNGMASVVRTSARERDRARARICLKKSAKSSYYWFFARLTQTCSYSFQLSPDLSGYRYFGLRQEDDDMINRNRAYTSWLILPISSFLVVLFFVSITIMLYDSLHKHTFIVVIWRLMPAS